MDIKRQAFESHFKTTEIYKRETQIRQKDILEFSSNFGYFNIIANNAWGMWQQAQKVAVPDGFVLIERSSLLEAVEKIEQLFEEDSLLALGELLPIQQGLKAMIEAQEQSNEYSK